MSESIVAQAVLKVKPISQYEKWLLNPYQAGREDTARARARYECVGGQVNYILLTNAKLYLEIAEHLVEKCPSLARYYLDLVKERIQMLEEE